MEFKERKETAERLADSSCIEADRSLLAQIHPGHALLRKPADGPGGDTLSYDIIYTLLLTDEAGEAAIRSNRENFSSQQNGTRKAENGTHKAGNDTQTDMKAPDKEAPAQSSVKKNTRSTRGSGGRSSGGRKSSGRS